MEKRVSRLKSRWGQSVACFPPDPKTRPSVSLLRPGEGELIENEVGHSPATQYPCGFQRLSTNRTIWFMSNRDPAGGVEGVANPISGTDMPYEIFSCKRGIHLVYV